jgi:hypothetical protein
MPTLIPDLARAMTDSNRRVAELVDAEVRRAEALREIQAEADTLRQRVAREAREVTRHMIAVTNEVEGLWSSALEALREGIPTDLQLNVLRAAVTVADSSRSYLKSARSLWSTVSDLGGEVEGAEVLAAAGRAFDRVRSEATRALEARTTPWQPADPDRLEQGRQELREGKALSPDEAKARFRTDRG